MSARGTSNTNQRGNTATRRALAQWMLDTFGDGELVLCWRCEVPLDRTTMQKDRVTPGKTGGRYVRGNVRPCCSPCNIETGNALRDGLLV